MSTDHAELRLGHLEMVQAVIARIAGYSASHKNFCVTLVTAAGGLAVTLHNPWIAVLSFLPVIVFAGLDAQYLRIERRYRALYEQVRLESPAAMPTFDLKPPATLDPGFFSTLLSWSVLAFYVPMLIGAGVVIYLAEVVNG